MKSRRVGQRVSKLYLGHMPYLDLPRYGIEIARLIEAQTDAKKAFDIARRGRVVTSVVQDIQAILHLAESRVFPYSL